MKNREKFAEKIFDIACDCIAVSNKTGEPKACDRMDCDECMFCKSCNEETVKAWANAEYIEHYKISKKDRDFLEYAASRFEYVARDECGSTYMYKYRPTKEEDRWALGGNYVDITVFDIKFPMVKWSDEEPWSIEDLKKLEVVEDYENN